MQALLVICFAFCALVLSGCGVPSTTVALDKAKAAKDTAVEAKTTAAKAEADAKVKVETVVVKKAEAEVKKTKDPHAAAAEKVVADAAAKKLADDKAEAAKDAAALKKSKADVAAANKKTAEVEAAEAAAATKAAEDKKAVDAPAAAKPKADEKADGAKEEPAKKLSSEEAKKTSKEVEAIVTMSTLTQHTATCTFKADQGFSCAGPSINSACCTALEHRGEGFDQAKAFSKECIQDAEQKSALTKDLTECAKWKASHPSLELTVTPTQHTFPTTNASLTTMAAVAAVCGLAGGALTMFAAMSFQTRRRGISQGPLLA